MSKQMLTIRLDPEVATIPEVTKRLQLHSDQIDSEYGVNCIDPERNLYVVMVEEDVAKRASATSEGCEGPFSNPRIEPFGPA